MDVAKVCCFSVIIAKYTHSVSRCVIELEANVPVKRLLLVIRQCDR